LPISSTKYVISDEESIKLAKKYIEEKVVGQTSFIDCLHIALATIQNANSNKLEFYPHCKRC